MNKIIANNSTMIDDKLDSPIWSEIGNVALYLGELKVKWISIFIGDLFEQLYEIYSKKDLSFDDQLSELNFHNKTLCLLYRKH